MIYLDNAATTYPKPDCVYNVLDKANRNAFNSGRGSYKIARETTKIIDETRQLILEINNIKNGKVIFTNSATTSLNNIIFGIDVSNGDNIYISPFEHNSVIRPLEELKSKININIHIIPFDKETWNLDIEKLQNMFALNKPKAIIISHISNVTGYILPYELIFKESLKYNSINILDSSQGYGIVKVKEIENINYIVFAGHKSLYGSFGIAGYIKLKNDILNKSIFGGTGSDTMNKKMSDNYPEGYEAGSLNSVAITGLNQSIKWLKETDVYNHELELTNYLIQELKKISKIKLYLPTPNESIFGIISINIDGYKSEEVGSILDDEFDICIRTGYHCAPLIHEFIESIEYSGTARISLGYFNTKEDIDNLISALKTL